MPSPVGALTKIKKMHSPLERAVVGHKLESMPSAQWQAYIKANAPKAAKKEALAVKLDELLARQPKVTKAEIVQHIKDNSPKIKTKILKNEPYSAGDIDSHVNIEPNGSGGYNYLDSNGDVAYNADSAKDMVNYLNESEGAKYGEHTLPGGENYREMLLSLPRNPSNAVIRSQKVYEIKDANGQLLATGQLPMSPRTQAKLNNNPDWVVREFEQPNPNDVRRDPANFQSGHYDQPNLLAHMRMNDRPTAEGKKALFLEELQSDWAQQGRKEGFHKTDFYKERRAEIESEMESIAKEVADMRARGERPIDLRVRYSDLSELLSSMKPSKGVSRAPYVEDTGDWTALGLKKAIEHAVEQGHDSVAWTTGAQQADRYSLAKQIDRIDHNLNDDGTYSFSAIKDGKEVIAKEGLTQDELADHLGKDVANKIVKGEGETPAIYGDVDAPPPYRSLSGLDLQVGGEGMKGYYDQIVPQTANDILKSMGVTERVKPIGIQLEKIVTQADIDAANRARNFDEGERLTHINERQQLGRGDESIRNSMESVQHMGFDITPEIRDYVMNQGLPAFAGGGVVKAAAKGLRGMADRYQLAMKVAQRNAALPVSEGGLGLPPDNTAIDRAIAMGFKGIEYHTTDAKNADDIYEGGFSNVSRGQRNFSALGKKYGKDRYYNTGVGNYTSDNPFASEFTSQGDVLADKVMFPLMVNKSKHFDYTNPEHVKDLMTPRKAEDYAGDFGTKEMSPSDLKALQEGQHHVMEDWLTTQNLKKRGYTGTNLREPQKFYGGEGTTTNTFDTRLFRSKFAAFDPMRRNENDILAGVGVGLPVSGVLAEQPLEKAEGGPVHMDEDGLNVRASGDYGNFDSEGSSGSHYNFSTDVDILNKYGFGVTKNGEIIKLPERSYTYEDGYTETQPARKIKRDDISELRARYTTDDGVQYGVGRQPLAKGWSGYRTDPRTQATIGVNVSPQYKNFSAYRNDPRSQSSVGVNVSPYYKGVSYTKNFAEGGKVEVDDVDYDEMYEFRDYGDRETGEAKDTGALGEIRMPNGRDVMTEYSINVDGREMPSIVEGMHPADVNYIRETGSVPQDAVATAIRSANKREARGLSPFWNKKDTPTFAQGGEVDYDAMYEFR